MLNLYASSDAPHTYMPVRVLLCMYASPNVPITACTNVFSYTFMQALMLQYLHVSSDADTLVCQSGCPYTFMQTLVFLYPYKNLHYLIPICKPWYSFISMQARMHLFSYASMGATTLALYIPRCSYISLQAHVQQDASLPHLIRKPFLWYLCNK